MSPTNDSPSPPRPKSSAGGRASAIVACLIAFALVAGGFAAPASAANIGFKDVSFVGSLGSPSGSKPESKLWWNDGFWWASMFDTVSKQFHTFKLNSATQTWTDTGVVLDTRTSSRADTLWDGTKLYVASHLFATNATKTTANPSKLYRFSYAGGAYTLDAGFPVNINNASSETLVIAKDSTGRLWATWTQQDPVTLTSKVYVNATVCSPGCNDATWGTPFVVPTTHATVNQDDISSVIAFGGNKTGVMWSNQGVTPGTDYFAVHSDASAPGTGWTEEVALSGAGLADDHVNLKTDPSTGRVYAAVKTSKTAAADPLVELLVRSSTGVWTNSTVWTAADSPTRPIVLLDTQNSVIHALTTCPQPPNTSGQSGGDICEKTSPLGAISFASGIGTAVIRDAASADMNNVTSTKQNLTSTTGLVALATNDTTDFYWHGSEALGGTPANTPPACSNTTLTTTQDTPGDTAPVCSDANSDPLTYSIVAQGTKGAASVVAGMLHYVPSAGQTGADSFTYKANDGSADSNVASVAVTINPAGGGGSLTLVPNGDGSRDAVIKTQAGATTSLFAAIDEGIASADDATTYVRNDNHTSGSYFALLSDTPASFAGMATLTIDIRARTTGVVDDSTTLFARLFKVDELTPLSGEVAVAVNPGSAAWTTVSGVSLPGLVAGSKADWDGARLRLRWAHAPVGTADTTQLRLTAVELHGSDTGGGSANSAPTCSNTTLTTAQDTPGDTAPVCSDANSDPLTYSIVAQGTKGTASVVAGMLHYVPNAGQTGADSFTYKANDGSADSNVATVAVTINPAGGGDTTLTFNPVGDAYVRSDLPSSNNGSATTLRVRDGSPVIHSFLKFTVSGLTGSVTSAKLRLFVTLATPDGGSVHSVADSSWTESAITWTSAPPIDPTVLGSAGATTVSTWVEISLPASSFAAGNGTYSLALENASSSVGFYSSKEGANAPQLVLTTG